MREECFKGRCYGLPPVLLKPADHLEREHKGVEVKEGASGANGAKMRLSALQPIILYTFKVFSFLATSR